jgi:acetolactate synthase regulatory subunit
MVERLPMTIQTQVLDMRLGQLHAKAQQALVSSGAVDPLEVADCWRALDGLEVELSQVLRRFDSLEQQRTQLLAGLGAASPDQRGREQSGIDAFESELLRVQRRAGLLVAAVVKLRRHQGDAANIDLTHAVCQIATQLGKSLDQFMVRLTVQQISIQPRLMSPSAALADTGNGVETLFVAIGMLMALIRCRGNRDH